MLIELELLNERGQTMTMHDVVPLVLLHLARNRGCGAALLELSRSLFC